MLAITFVVASIVVSCKNKIKEADKIDMSQTPLQTVEDMFAVNTKNGLVSMRMEAPMMQHFETDSTSEDVFPHGLRSMDTTKKACLRQLSCPIMHVI